MAHTDWTDNKLFLLDAYALIFRAYFAFSKNPLINSKGQNVSAISGFTNTLVELNAATILALLQQIKQGTYKKGKVPTFWDGRASERIVNEVVAFFDKQQAATA